MNRQQEEGFWINRCWLGQVPHTGGYWQPEGAWGDSEKDGRAGSIYLLDDGY